MITSQVQIPPLLGKTPAFTDGTYFANADGTLETWTDIDNGAVLPVKKVDYWMKGWMRG